MKLFAILSTICLIYTRNVDAIKCFQCSSMDAGCDQLGQNDTGSPYFRECNGSYQGNQPFCRKTVQTIIDADKLVRINRECGWHLHKWNESNCYQNDDDFKFEKSCQCFTDGCNAATKGLLSAIALSISSLIYLLI